MTTREIYQQYQKLHSQLEANSKKGSIIYTRLMNNPFNSELAKDYYLLGKQTERIISALNNLPSISL